MPAVVVAVAGVILSLGAWQARVRGEERLIGEEFALEAQALAGSIQKEVMLFLDVQESIRHLHTISDSITAAEFEEFISKGMRYQVDLLGAVGFVQRIEHGMRTSFEGSAASTGLVIQEPDGAGGFRRAADRADYWPLTYQQSESSLGVPTGYDFAVREKDRAAIERMAAFGDPVVAGTVISAATDSEDPGCYVFAPILYPTVQGLPVPPPGYLEGFTVAVFRPRTILARALAGLRPHDLRVCLKSPTGEEACLSGERPRRRDTQAPPAEALAGLLQEAPIIVANEQWTLQCMAAESYADARRTNQPITVLLAGLLTTGLLTVLLGFMAGRTRGIERVVQARTADLREANRRVHDEMEERMRLEEEILEIGNREKARVGRDLHDSLGQMLTGAAFLSRSLLRRLSSAPEEDRQNAEQINSILRESVTEVRRIARGLAPIELQDEGLPAALGRLARETEKTYQVHCEFVEAAEPSVDDKVAVHLYHIAQEALNNAIRHGKPANVRISLSMEENHGTLEIVDDGAGLPADARGRGGMGLRIMQHRAYMIGGELDVTARSEGGTKVVCRFPLSEIEG